MKELNIFLVYEFSVGQAENLTDCFSIFPVTGLLVPSVCHWAGASLTLAATSSTV